MSVSGIGYTDTGVLGSAIYFSSNEASGTAQKGDLSIFQVCIGSASYTPNFLCDQRVLASKYNIYGAATMLTVFVSHVTDAEAKIYAWFPGASFSTIMGSSQTFRSSLGGFKVHAALDDYVESAADNEYVPQDPIDTPGSNAWSIASMLFYRQSGCSTTILDVTDSQWESYNWSKEFSIWIQSIFASDVTGGISGEPYIAENSGGLHKSLSNLWIVSFEETSDPPKRVITCS
jgi:hypothetical protein